MIYGFILSSLLLAAGVTCDDHWDYEGKEADWSKVNKECKVGRAQSPIDIQTKNVIWDKDLHLQYQNFDKEIDGEHFNLVNNGHSVQLTLNKDTFNASAIPSVTGSAVGGANETYEFVQLHFHWDTDDKHGSEHAIDGHRYALEMHYVLANSKYGGDVSTASQHEDGLVVLATIFHTSNKKNETYMQPLLNGLDRVIEEGSNTTLFGERLLLDHILPIDRDLFFKYQGSLTTPPCSQAVTWIVFRDISAINKRQLSYFRAMTKHDPSNRVVKIGHNVRELQLQEDRKVYGSVGKRVGSKQGFLDKVRNLLGFPKEEPAVKLM